MRAKRAIFVLAALFSLCASTLAACGCSHHEVAAAPVENSCHGTSQAAPETIDLASSGDKVQIECNCRVRETGPSLSSKSKVPTNSLNAVPVEQGTFEVDRIPVTNSAVTANYDSLIAHYDSRHGTRAPARAPPRL